MTPTQFRALFPALKHYVWLDTPGCAPGAAPVLDAVAAALDAWRSGEFDWRDWDRAPTTCRELFAGFAGVPAANVALLGSVAEAAATIAASLPAGRVVVAADEFRSNLYPWQALGRTHEVVTVDVAPNATRTEALVSAITPSTILVAASEVLSHDGRRVDLGALREATDAVGARLFVDLTQSLGVLHFDAGRLAPDYLAVHGYKWLLCPRGAAWMVVREDHHRELTALVPSWKTAVDGAYFGGALRPKPGAHRCDSSPAWHSWVGAQAALTLLAALPAREVERHALTLAEAFLQGAQRAGYPPVGVGQGSHIAAVEVHDPAAASSRLVERGVRATVLGNRLRVGFHYFNGRGDVAAALAALTGS